MPYLRAALVIFAIAVIACVALYFLRGDRKYLRWAGRLFAVGLGAAVFFFAMLLIERFT